MRPTSADKRSSAGRVVVGVLAVVAVYAAFGVHRALERYRPTLMRHAELPEPLRPYRPWWMQLLHSMPVRDPISEKALLATGERQSGFADYGESVGLDPTEFFAGLRVLVNAIGNESALTMLGTEVVRPQVETYVTNRLKLVQYLKEHPDVMSASNEIVAPVFIVGMPRAGTTFLHNLLAQDTERFRAPSFWEVMDFVPPPTGQEPWWHPRILKQQAQLRSFQVLAPHIWAVHPLNARHAEECLPLMAMNMASVQFDYVNHVPSHTDWLMRCEDQSSTFRVHRRALQIMQSAAAPSASTGEKKTWLLKSPWHMNHLLEVLKEYPDAIFIAPHRDPKKVISSVSSLSVRFHGVVSDALEPEKMGPVQTARWAEIARRFARARAKVDPRQAMDIRFRDLSADPMRVVEKVYAKFGWELSYAVRLRMQRFLEESDFKQGHHEYKLEWFGVTGNDVDEAFAEYIDRYV